MPGLLLTYSSYAVRCYIGIIFNVYRILSGLGECKYTRDSILIMYDLQGFNCLKDGGHAWKSFYGLATCYYLSPLLLYVTHIPLLFSVRAFLRPSLRHWSVIFYNLRQAQCCCLLLFYCSTMQIIEHFTFTMWGRHEWTVFLYISMYYRNLLILYCYFFWHAA